MEFQNAIDNLSGLFQPQEHNADHSFIQVQSVKLNNFDKKEKKR